MVCRHRNSNRLRIYQSENISGDWNNDKAYNSLKIMLTKPSACLCLYQKEEKKIRYVDIKSIVIPPPIYIFIEYPCFISKQIVTISHQIFPLQIISVRFKNRSRLSVYMYILCVCVFFLTDLRLSNRIFIITDWASAKYQMHFDAVINIWTHDTFTSIHCIKYSRPSSMLVMSDGHPRTKNSLKHFSYLSFFFYQLRRTLGFWLFGKTCFYKLIIIFIKWLPIFFFGKAFFLCVRWQ